MDQINNYINLIMSKFDDLMLNKYFSTIFTVFLTVYAVYSSPKLPSFVKELFNNSIIKIIMITFIGYRANKDPQTSLLIAICFVITLNLLNENETNEAFEQIETFNQLDNFNNKLDINNDI